MKLNKKSSATGAGQIAPVLAFEPDPLMRSLGNNWIDLNINF